MKVRVFTLLRVTLLAAALFAPVASADVVAPPEECASWQERAGHSGGCAPRLCETDDECGEGATCVVTIACGHRAPDPYVRGTEPPFMISGPCLPDGGCQREGDRCVSSGRCSVLLVPPPEPVAEEEITSWLPAATVVLVVVVVLLLVGVRIRRK